MASQKTNLHEVSGRANNGQANKDFALKETQHARSTQCITKQPLPVNASSVGAGIRYNLRSNVTASFDYGSQLIHLPNSDGKDQLAAFAVTLSN